MFINKGVYLRFVTDELELRTLQLLSIRNLAAIDAHWVMYITTAYRRCVRMYLHTRGSSLLVSTERASSKASIGGTGIIRFHAFFIL